jgi:hypothetical protein
MKERPFSDMPMSIALIIIASCILSAITGPFVVDSVARCPDLRTKVIGQSKFFDALRPHPQRSERSHLEAGIFIALAEVFSIIGILTRLGLVKVIDTVDRKQKAANKTLDDTSQ